MRNYSKYEGLGIQVYVDDTYDVRKFRDHIYVNADNKYETDLTAKIYKESMDEYYYKIDGSFVIGGVVTHYIDEEKGQTYVVLERGVVMGLMEEDNPEFVTMKKNYKDVLNQDSIQEEKEFKANSVSVSYDDLLRYPETWQDVPIYLKLKVDDIDYPTGFLDAALNGTTYLCVIPGTSDELLVYDLRDNKEPTIMVGDTISFYGYLDGLGSIKVYDSNKIINNTIDRYQVPKVYIRYM